MGHHHPPTTFNRAFAITVVATLGFTIAESFFAIHANSMSLLADAVHNLGDSLGLILAWLANWLLSLPAKKQFSYGYKRTTIIASLVNAFILVSSSAVIAVEAVQKFFHPSLINDGVVISVAIIGVIINGGASLLFMRGAHSDLNIKAAFYHLVADALILLGVIVATIGIRYTNWLWIDPIVSLLIVIIILLGTWGLLKTSLALMLDAVPPYIDINGIKKYLSNYAGVVAIHDLHIWGLSTREVALTVHLTMPEKKLTDRDYQKINKVLHDKFHIHHATLQVESGIETFPCGRKEHC